MSSNTTQPYFEYYRGFSIALWSPHVWHVQSYTETTTEDIFLVYSLESERNFLKNPLGDFDAQLTLCKTLVDRYHDKQPIGKTEQMLMGKPSKDRTRQTKEEFAIALDTL